jgi:hypothetical protein
MKGEENISLRDGVVLGILMLEVVLLIAVPSMRDMRAHRREARTMSAMRDVARRLEDPAVAPPTDVLDGWGTPLRAGRVAPATADATPVVLVVSAGADAIFEEPSLERAAAAPFAATLHEDADLVFSDGNWQRHPGS